MQEVMSICTSLGVSRGNIGMAELQAIDTEQQFCKMLRLVRALSCNIICLLIHLDPLQLSKCVLMLCGPVQEINIYASGNQQLLFIIKRDALFFRSKEQNDKAVLLLFKITDMLTINALFLLGTSFHSKVKGTDC